MKIPALALLALAAAPMAFSNTPLLVNTEFQSWDKWIFGANKFRPVATWLEFVQAPTAFSYESRVKPSGTGFTFTSWDDGTSDKIEAYIFQEFHAGPAASAWPSIFQTGDVIAFKGSASATRSGANTSDMVVRAFIKVLGYNELGWEFQTKTQYSAFHNIGTAKENFDLSISFPDLAVDSSLQVLQLGFEITTLYDAVAKTMDSGVITFENLEGYIVGEETPKWAGYDVRPDGYCDTGAWLGWVYVTDAPWVWMVSLNSYAYIPENSVTAGGGWAYVSN